MDINSPLSVPPAATKYILFQRTQYLFFRRSRLMRFIGKCMPKRLAQAMESLFSNFNASVSIESVLRRREVARLLDAEMRTEYNQMKAFLPNQARSILDVGCGVAAIDVFLAAHYAPAYPNIYLLDKTEMPGKVYYGFRPQGCYYNSLDESKHLLEQNGVPSKSIFLEEARDNVIGFTGPFDLVVSLISWGFHYPVSVYLERVYELMAPGGVLIMDIRKVDTDDGLAAVKRRFKTVRTISESSKNTRIAAYK